MNEGINIQMVSTRSAAPTSSKGTVESSLPVQHKTGNELPTVRETSSIVAIDSAADTRQRIETAVASMNDFVQSVQRDLRFTVDEELDKTIIKVIDSMSGDLIRQIPEEVFLELARKLKDGGELQLVNAMS